MALSHQYDAAVKKANVLLQCIRRDIFVERGRNANSISQSLPETSFGIILCPTLFPCSEQKDGLKLEQVQRQTTRLIRVTEYLCFKEQIRKLLSFSLVK